jgi:hypothetical protein
MRHALLNLDDGLDRGYDNIDNLFLPISAEAYHSLKEAVLSLAEVAYIEEKFDIVMENMFDLESEFLRITEKHLLFSSEWVRDNNWATLTINRRLINLLTACRLYLDHAHHHLHKLFGKGSDKVIAIEQCKSRQYDHFFGYRFMEAMRNFVQHRGYPISHLVLSSKAVKNKEYDVGYPRGKETLVRADIFPVFLFEDIKNDPKFKKSIIEEIEKLDPPIVNLKLAIREYVEGINNIHRSIRDCVKNYAPHWERRVTRAIDHTEQMLKYRPIKLIAVKVGNDGKQIEHIPLSEKRTADIKKLVAKNDAHIYGVARSFVASEALMDEQVVNYIRDADREDITDALEAAVETDEWRAPFFQ